MKMSANVPSAPSFVAKTIAPPSGEPCRRASREMPESGSGETGEVSARHVRGLGQPARRQSGAVAAAGVAAPAGFRLR